MYKIYTSKHVISTRRINILHFLDNLTPFGMTRCREVSLEDQEGLTSWQKNVKAEEPIRIRAGGEAETVGHRLTRSKIEISAHGILRIHTLKTVF